jgi:hypothetical protein
MNGGDGMIGYGDGGGAGEMAYRMSVLQNSEHGGSWSMTHGFYFYAYDMQPVDAWMERIRAEISRLRAQGYDVTHIIIENSKRKHGIGAYIDYGIPSAPIVTVGASWVPLPELANSSFAGLNAAFAIGGFPAGPILLPNSFGSTATYRAGTNEFYVGKIFNLRNYTGRQVTGHEGILTINTNYYNKSIDSYDATLNIGNARLGLGGPALGGIIGYDDGKAGFSLNLGLFGGSLDIWHTDNSGTIVGTQVSINLPRILVIVFQWGAEGEFCPVPGF